MFFKQLDDYTLIEKHWTNAEIDFAANHILDATTKIILVPYSYQAVKMNIIICKSQIH